MPRLCIFFDHAMGYALFRVVDYEDPASLIQQVKNAVSDVSTFREIVSVVSFKPFGSGRDALDYMNKSSEGVLLDSVESFLQENLPKSKKKHPVILGVQEPKLATAISETLGVNCAIEKEVFEEVNRGIRLHFHNLVEGIKDLTVVCKSQLALGHHSARSKVKFNVNRIDNMVIQSINLIDQLDKDINTFAMRVREWYSFHFPELFKVVPENQLYVRCVDAIKNRKDMPENIQEQLEEILMDSEKAENVLKLAHSSMGMEISALDMVNVTLFAKRVNSLMTRRKELMEYLKVKMHNVAPNLAALIGETVGARLISHAGSLVNLAKFPASTVQILGAEKALFRAIKTRGNTPKYGLIYHSTFIGRAGKAHKGRISRYLANKCSVATRIDCFRDIPTEVFGSKLKQQVEDRLEFYESGNIPAKNFDVMVDALNEAEIVSAAIAKERRKAEKKRRKSQLLSESFETSVGDVSITDQNEENQTVNSEKKKKKRKRSSLGEADECEKKKRKVEVDEVTENENLGQVTQIENEETKINPLLLITDEEMAQITDPVMLKKIRKARKKANKSAELSQLSINGIDGDSVLSNNVSMLTNASSLTNASLNCTMNSSMDASANEPGVDNSSAKKKKKKKKKSQDMMKIEA